MLDEQRLDNLYWLEASQEEVMTEGANLDVRRIFVAHRKELKKACKSVTKAYKRGEYSDAKKNITKTKKIIDDIYKDISKIQLSSGIGSTILGWIFGDVMFIGRTLIGLILTPLSPVLKVINLIERVEVAMKDCRDEKRDMNLGDINLYINGIKVRLTEYKKILDRIERLIDASESDAKSNKK